METYYFRTKMWSRRRLDADGRPIPGQPPEIVFPVLVPLLLSLEQAQLLTGPGMLEVKLPGGQVLDLVYGYSLDPETVMARGLEYLNE